MSLDHHQGNRYGNTTILGKATTQLGDVIHNYHSNPYDSLWALSQIVHTIKSFDHIWDGSPTVFASHREAQPRYERETHQSVNLSRQDSKFSSRDQTEYEIRRNYWIQKRCRESDIVAGNGGYDELHELSGAFIGMNQDHDQGNIHHHKPPRPIQQFVYQLSKEAERIKSEDSCREEIRSNDVYSVAFEIVKRVWISQKTWDKDWRILPGESWKKEEEPLGEQLVNEGVPAPADAQFHSRNKIREKSDMSSAGHHFPETDTHHQPEVSGACPGHFQSRADSRLAELDGISITASPPPTTSRQALPDRRFRKETVSSASGKGYSENLQNFHEVKSAPSMLTRSRKDIHNPPPSSPVRNESKQRSTPSIPRRTSRNTSSPATKVGGVPNRTLEKEDPGKSETPKSSSRSRFKRHGKPKGNLTKDATPEN